jgi:threonine dehydratase
VDRATVAPRDRAQAVLELGMALGGLAFEGQQHDRERDLDRIALAASTIDPVFRDSPQFVDERLCAALGREVLEKVETLNPLHSFKGRGAEFFAGGLPPARRVVCASSGNFGSR